MDTGFSTSLGLFTSQVNASEDGNINGLKLSTPPGTTGAVRLVGVRGKLTSESGTSVTLTDGIASNISGGSWTLVPADLPVVQAANAASRTSMSRLALVTAMLALLL